jgi:hypothetical protein
VTALPIATSGAMYAGEPSTRPALVIGASATLRAMPKSVSFTRPSSAMSTLPGFTSRWVMPLRCAARNPPAVAKPTTATWDTVSVPWSLIIVARLRDGTSSITTIGSPSTSTTSNTVMMLGWERPPSARASRMIRSRASAASWDGTPGGTFSSLTATRRCSTSSKPDHTVPIAPAPSSPDSV